MEVLVQTDVHEEEGVPEPLFDTEAEPDAERVPGAERLTKGEEDDERVPKELADI